MCRHKIQNVLRRCLGVVVVDDHSLTATQYELREVFVARALGGPLLRCNKLATTFSPNKVLRRRCGWQVSPTVGESSACGSVVQSSAAQGFCCKPTRPPIPLPIFPLRYYGGGAAGSSAPGSVIHSSAAQGTPEWWNHGENQPGSPQWEVKAKKLGWDPDYVQQWVAYYKKVQQYQE